MMKRNGDRRKRMLAVWLLLAMTAGLPGGCGKNGQTGAPGTQGAVSEKTDGANTSDMETGEADEKDGAPEDGGTTAMGRYIETTVDLSEYVTRDHCLTQLADGSLLILDEKAGQIISTDGGESWETKPIPGIDDLDAFTKENYIFQMRAGLDGTIYVLSSPNTNGTGEFHVGLLVGKPDGSSQMIEELTTEGLVPDIWVSPENRLFVKVLGTSGLYELHLEDESLTKYMTLENQPDLVQFQGEVIYVAGKGGVYRHVIGGSAMEQIIDGGLSSFSNPAMKLRGMITLPQDEFLVLFSGGQLIRYTYDPNVPTVPEDLVKVYSLEEWDAVRQAIAERMRTRN